MILHPDGRLEATPEEMARYQQCLSQQTQWPTPEPRRDTGYPWREFFQPTTISDGVVAPPNDWFVANLPYTGGDYAHAQFVPANVTGVTLDVRI